MGSVLAVPGPGLLRQSRDLVRALPETVTSIIAGSLPWTIGLVGAATILSVVFGSLIGTYLGWRRGTWADAILPVTTFFSAVPYFWLGLLFIALFGVTWRLFPIGGAYDGALIPGWDFEFIGSVLQHAFLPAFTIILSSIAGWILGMRNMMVTVTSEDYVTVAQAKGLPERKVMYGYSARNAVLPQVSGFALSLGFVVSGTLVVELVFSLPRHRLPAVPGDRSARLPAHAGDLPGDHHLGAGGQHLCRHPVRVPGSTDSAGGLR